MLHTKNLPNMFGFKDMVFYCVSAILLVEQIAMSASVGPYAVFWWLVTVIFFMLPNTMVTSELGASYPEQGGIYAWVRDAFGARWGARITWLYWINIALWVPSVFIMFSGMLSAMFIPDMRLWSQIAVAICLCVLLAAVNSLPLNYTKWALSIATPLKFIIVLVIGFAGINYGMSNGFANDLSLATATSDWSAGLAYIPVIVYGCLGLELIMSESKKIISPDKNIPKAMFASGLITAILYVFGSVGVLAAVPAEEVEIVTIFAVTLQELFGGTPWGDKLVLVLGIATLFTFFASMIAWTLGGNAAMAEAGQEGEMPRLFAILTKKYDMPLGSAVILASVCVLMLIVYGVMAKNAEELYWTLFSFGAIIFLMPYIAMHCSFLKLRLRDPLKPRPFKVPGGMVAAHLIAGLCIGILVMSITLFFWIPGEPFDLNYVLQVSIGLLITLLVGEALVRRSEHTLKHSKFAPHV
ncbi:APC family permease [Pseudoalteromonas sp. YIC-656]|uniref:APC family permease n=1 Tax=Pseudoalteromonas pernae TaxID=3118054 RepID=UPI003242A7FA